MLGEREEEALGEIEEQEEGVREVLGLPEEQELCEGEGEPVEHCVAVRHREGVGDCVEDALGEGEGEVVTVSEGAWEGVREAHALSEALCDSEAVCEAEKQPLRLGITVGEEETVRLREGEDSALAERVGV